MANETGLSGWIGEGAEGGTGTAGKSVFRGNRFRFQFGDIGCRCRLVLL